MGAERGRHAALGLSCLLACHGWPLRVPTSERTPAEIWEMGDKELAGLLNVSGPASKRLAAFRRGFDPRRFLAGLEAAGISVLTLGDGSYPEPLAGIHDPPPALYLKGCRESFLQMMAGPRVAMVGARAASAYGKDVASRLARDLSRQGVCVVSGMAFGIDAASHRGSLEGPGGAVAVLGSGVDVVYPRAHARLYRTIIERGAVVSEYPPGEQPMPWRFPARNRIIAGLSQGVVVVEAKGKSGALITADFCMEEGREVWAVPGSIFSDLSEGAHHLLRQGAAAATGAGDILEDLGIEARKSPAGSSEACHMPAGLSRDEKLILAQLGPQPLYHDRLAELAGLDGSRTAAAIISLELKGLVRDDPARGGTFKL